eukprot:5609088-Prymnesium_polylepis.1
MVRARRACRECRREDCRTYVGARFGTCLACVRPGMTQSLGADCSPPGISPSPCGGHGPRKAGCTSPARWA